MQFSRSAFLTLVRASAAYDLLLTAPFATPWTFAFAHAQLSRLNGSLGGDALPVAQGDGNSAARAPFTSAAPMRSSRGG